LNEAGRPIFSPAVLLHVSLTECSRPFDSEGIKLGGNIQALFHDGRPSMSLLRFFPAMCISLVALFNLTPALADNSVSARPTDWAQPVGVQYNLFQMSSTLYRSALPDSGALPLLEKLKVGTVISFLPESDASWLSTAKVTQVHLPYRTNHVDDADILNALRTIQTAEANGPVLMHCKHGSDRTGLIAAMYRVVVQGWSKEEALNEMTQGGFGDSTHFKDGVRYMMQADVDKLRTALANGDCSTSPFAACSMKNWFQSAHLQ
jgi:protein tyrosine/serine phosphatase